MEEKQLRECLGLFATGVIIACARKRNFLAENFFADKILENKIFEKNFFGDLSMTKISDKIKLPDSLKFSESFVEKFRNFSLAKNLAQKLKKIFTDEFFGMTINSFSSISLHPRLVMFCIDNRSSNLNLFKKNRYFSLNVLSLDQKELASAFAITRNLTKWEVEPYFFSKKGNPIFQNSLGFFECKKHRIIKAGDHHIMIGEILDFGKISDKEPLLYYKGKYSALKS